MQEADEWENKAEGEGKEEATSSHNDAVVN